MQVLTDTQVREIKAAFVKADAENYGNINSKELRYAMRELGFETSGEDILKILADANEEWGGTIGYANFLKNDGSQNP